jgi:hypothetical protein
MNATCTVCGAEAKREHPLFESPVCARHWRSAWLEIVTVAAIFALVGGAIWLARVTLSVRP